MKNRSSGQTMRFEWAKFVATELLVVWADLSQPTALYQGYEKFFYVVLNR